MVRPALVLPAAALLLLLCTGCSGGAADAVIVVRYSRFVPDVVTAPAGVPVRITLRNDDPIEHEWIVGTEKVHARHRTGTEPYHDEIPTEVTLPALSERVTTVVFDEPGEYRYICHLPGHEDYGMVGVLRVVGD